MQRIKNMKSLSRAVMAALFLSVQGLICLGTVYWVIAEVLRVDGTFAWILAAIFLLPAAYIVFKACHLAYEAETDPMNQ
jgi:hypothetical protein